MVGHEKTSRTNGINLSNLHEPVLHFPFVYQQPTHHCNENLPNFGSKSAFMRLSPLDQITGAALVIGVALKQRSPSRRPRNAEISLHRVAVSSLARPLLRPTLTAAASPNPFLRRPQRRQSRLPGIRRTRRRRPRHRNATTNAPRNTEWSSCYVT